jgi:hypothetical protein
MTSWETFTSACQNLDNSDLSTHLAIDRFIFYEPEQSKLLVLQDKVKGQLDTLTGHIKGDFGVVPTRVSSHLNFVFDSQLKFNLRSGLPPI